MKDRQNFMKIETPDEIMSIVGTLRPATSGLTLSNDTTLKLDDNFFLIQALAIKEMEEIVGMNFKPFVLELSDLSPAAFTSIWKPINLSSYRHFGYAAQWFGLSLVLVLGVFVYLFRGKIK